jgi:hypothetical protein
MKNRACFISTFLACCCLLYNVSSGAESLAVQNAQGINYVTGGVGEDEVEEIRALIPQYSLRVIFSEGVSGRSATDVNVTIYDTMKKIVLNVESAQPQLLVNLPAGKYKIVADLNGEKQSHPFTISANAHKKIILNWKSSVEDEQVE